MPTFSKRLRLPKRFLTPCRISRSDWTVPQPRSRNACWLSHVIGLACSLFAHHYSGNRGCFIFLWVLRCFTSPRYLHLPYVFRQGRWAITPIQVSLFGNPRIEVWLPTPRGLSQAPTSFFGSWCQGIHRVPLLTWRLQLMLASTVQFSRYGRSRRTHHRVTRAGRSGPRDGKNARSLRTQQRARPSRHRRHPSSLQLEAVLTGFTDD